VVKIQPDNAGVRLLQAQILERQHKRPEAIQSLREAIRLRSSYCEAHDLLGIELGLDGKLAEAEAEFEEVVRLQPNKADGHLNLGISLARQERYAESLAQFQTALRLDPENAKALEFVATLEQRGIRPATPP
jgi:tetratricopeptide (TPR) repeat protein